MAMDIECNLFTMLSLLFLESDTEGHEVEPCPSPIAQVNCPLNRHCPK